MVEEKDFALLTDLYELTMCASYFDNKINDIATFDLFIRQLPENRNYFIAAGLEDALNYLKRIRFTDEHIEYLKSKKIFKNDFLNYLNNFKFTGNVFALPEGTVFFPNEPIISITAPIIEAQLVETFLLNAINLQTTIATKASRVVLAAKQKPVVDFSLRRTQGTDAGMKVARASYIAGCIGTSNVLAGMKYEIPIYGTMAHSFVMAFEKEEKSFHAYSKTFPRTSTFLVDTYDTLKGMEKAAIVAKQLEKQGHKLKAIRLDSGDLVLLSRAARKILDKNGLSYVDIFASGNLDEYETEELLKKGALIDAFGVGTAMGVSKDAPYCDVVYKLVELSNHGKLLPTMKLSKGKVTYPGIKQVYRIIDKNGNCIKDILALRDEKVSGNILLIKVMENGKITYKMPSLEEIRETTKENLSKLPEKYKKIKNATNYKVEISDELRKLTSKLNKSLQQKV
ncbi:nicotinate phosphoribosyltransferase [Candidatus Woesearchaeota archaeon]|nr:nicotinate phosphoribosyltransferase [Candidatus Woesearchaeota archaeon]